MKHSTALRIVSLAPSATSILCAIGAKSSLVGVTKWCADVAPVKNLPRLGDCWHMDSVGKILALRPNLVIGCIPYKQETVAELLAHPLNFLAMNPRSLSDIENDFHLLGKIVNREKAATRVVQKIRRAFADIRRKAARSAKPLRVYCEAWPHPRISSPPWVAELVRIAGATMVVPAGQKVSDTQVADAQPDVIVLAWAATGAKANSRKTYSVAAWKDVPAIRHRHVYVVRDELLNTPALPLIAGARELLRIFQSVNQRFHV